MANRQAKRTYKRVKHLPGYAEGGPIFPRDDPRYAANQLAGAGTVGRAQAGRMAQIDAAEASALQPTTATPEPVATPPVPRKKFLGLFADGGRIGLRTVMEAEEPWKKDASGNFTGTEWQRSSTGSIIPDAGQNDMGVKIGSLIRDDEGGLDLFAPKPAPTARPSFVDQGKRYADGGQVNPLEPLIRGSGPMKYIEALPKAPTMGNPPMLRGGPETDNLSTARYANKYEGPGGLRGIPHFARGGMVGSPYRYSDPLDEADQVSHTPDYRRMMAAKAGALGRADNLPEEGLRTVPMSVTPEELAPLDMTQLKKKYGYADGGGLPAMRGHQINRKGKHGKIEDGAFYGEGGPTEDKIDIKASPGEFIVPADSTEKIGLGKLRDMVAATHKPVHLTPFDKDGAPRFAVWDYVPEWMKNIGRRGTAGVKAGVAAAAEPLPEIIPPATRIPPTALWAGGGTAPGPDVNTARGLGQYMNRALPAVRAIPHPAVRAAGLALTAAPFLGIADSLGGDHEPSPGGDKSDIPSGPSPELVEASKNYVAPAGPPPGLGLADKGDRNPAFRDTSFVDPTVPVRGTADAMGLKAPVGGGTISGGGRSMSYTKDSLPQPMGVTDTSTPEEKAADAARRAGWVAQSKAIDDKNAAAAAFENRSLNDMVQRSQQNVSNYELRQGLKNRDPAAVAAAAQQLEQIKTGQARDLARDLKSQEVVGEMAKAGVLAAAARYGADMGLRGHELTAQASLMGNIISHDAALRTLEHTIGKDNAKDFQEELAARAQAFTKDQNGKPIFDPEATARNVANLKRFMIDPSADHLAILQGIQPGARTLKDVPREKWGSVLDRAQINIGIGAAAGGEGMPAKYGIRERSVGDAFAGRGRNSQVPFWSSAGNALNPFAPPERNYTVSTETPGSLPTDTVLEDLAAGDRGRYETILSQLRKSGDPKQQAIADELMKRRGLK